MRVVLDTGILIAALITKNTLPDRLYQLWREKRFTLITSEWQLSEFKRVSRYPKLRPYLKQHEVGTMIQGLRTNTIVFSDLPRVDVSEDPDDNPILATALAGKADFIVTGDKRDLLSLNKFEGIPIVTARTLVEMLD